MSYHNFMKTIAKRNESLHLGLKCNLQSSVNKL